MGKVKNSKRWCAAPCGREVPIEEKFEYKEDKDKRVYLPEFKMRKSDVAYVKEAARRHGVSASCELERILTRAFSCSVLGFRVVLYRDNGKKRVIPPYTPRNSVKRPKYTIHPSFIRLLKEEAGRGNVSVSLVVYKIFLIYRVKFPIYLGSHLM